MPGALYISAVSVESHYLLFSVLRTLPHFLKFSAPIRTTPILYFVCFLVPWMDFTQSTWIVSLLTLYYLPYFIAQHRTNRHF